MERAGAQKRATEHTPKDQPATCSTLRRVLCFGLFPRPFFLVRWPETCQKLGHAQHSFCRGGHKARKTPCLLKGLRPHWALPWFDVSKLFSPPQGVMFFSFSRRREPLLCPFQACPLKDASYAPSPLAKRSSKTEAKECRRGLDEASAELRTSSARASSR